MATPHQSLKEYNRKRDFSKTSEPKGEVARRSKSGLTYLIQKHAATRLHYDFRLEWDGVLKSWAVTRGPSLDPEDKRLAVRTEDHPMAYGDFEGTIPKGEYGGGTVMLWDVGHWEPLEDPDEGLKEGKLKFRLYGRRLGGSWALVRMKPRPGEKHENWLLIKERDAEASDDGESILREKDTSAVTGRTMAEIAAGKGESKPHVWHSNEPVSENLRKGALAPLPGKVKKKPTPKRPASPPSAPRSSPPSAPPHRKATTG